MNLIKFSLISLIGAMTSLAALAVTTDDLKSSFLAARLDIQGPYYVAEFAVDATGKKVEFRDASIEGARPKGDCLGQMDIKNNILEVNVNCASLGGSPLKFEVKLDGITLDQLNSDDGVQVQVRSAATQNQWMPFKTRKLAKSFFEGT